MVFLLRVLVTRTSVVEMGSKHLGDALKECRKASEVSGAARQQAPPHEGHSQATEKAADLDGAGSHSPSAKVLRWDSKLERESVKASDLGARRSKDPSSPSIGMLANR